MPRITGMITRRVIETLITRPRNRLLRKTRSLPEMDDKTISIEFLHKQKKHKNIVHIFFLFIHCIIQRSSNKTCSILTKIQQYSIYIYFFLFYNVLSVNSSCIPNPSSFSLSLTQLASKDIASSE